MKTIDTIKWLGHASFYFEDTDSGKRIYYIDPFELDQKDLPYADIVFITHVHQDHLSPADIKIITDQNSVFVGPPDCLNKINVADERKYWVEPLESYTIKGFTFETFPAYNVRPDRLNHHPKDKEWVGYIFEINGQKIYHAGDTDFIPEMNALQAFNLDVALLPIGGIYTMDWVEAAEAATAIAAKYTIPMHYKRLLKDKAQESAEQFKVAVTNSEVILLEEFA